jgi:four helix bundle protein
MFVKSFKQLIVWQKSVELAKIIYLITNDFPRSEIYGLTSQMRRAAVSIPSNIAEGKRRKTLKDYLQFLHIADGSAAELETQIIIAKDLFKKIDFVRAESILIEIQKMLATLIRKLESLRSINS